MTLLYYHLFFVNLMYFFRFSKSLYIHISTFYIFLQYTGEGDQWLTPLARTAWLLSPLQFSPGAARSICWYEPSDPWFTLIAWYSYIFGILIA